MFYIRKYSYFLVVVQVFLFASLMPGTAFAKTPYQPYHESLTDMATMQDAQASNAVEQFLCNTVIIMSDTTGSALAIITLIGVGIGALFGRITSEMATVVALGIGLIFGASSVVGGLGGNNSTCKAHNIDGDCPEFDYTEYGYDVEQTICTGSVIQFMQKE